VLICGQLVSLSDFIFTEIIADVFFSGCILGEMLLGKPLFQGTSTFNQLERILQHIPTPSQSDIASISSQYGPSVLERASSG
jgi:mitogen-activated protein kinase 15